MQHYFRSACNTILGVRAALFQECVQHYFKIACYFRILRSSYHLLLKIYHIMGLFRVLVVESSAVLITNTHIWSWRHILSGSLKMLAYKYQHKEFCMILKKEGGRRGLCWSHNFWIHYKMIFVKFWGGAWSVPNIDTILEEKTLKCIFLKIECNTYRCWIKFPNVE